MGGQGSEKTQEKGDRETWRGHGVDTKERAKGTGRDFSPMFPDNTLLLFEGKGCCHI